MLNINTTVKAFLTIIEQSNKVDQVATASLLAKSLKANNDTPPTVDTDGRLHAPFTGYVWGEDTYHGGSYLSEEYDCKHVQDNKTRFKTTLATAKEMKLALSKVLGVSFGNSWIDSGIEICYCYVTGLTLTQAKEVNALIVMLQKELAATTRDSRGTILEGKQALTLKVVSSFSVYNNYTGEHDCKLNLTNDDNISIIVNVTAKIWDLVEENIDELFGKTISLAGNVKDLGERKYQLLRPSKIMLVA